MVQANIIRIYKIDDATIVDLVKDLSSLLGEPTSSAFHIAQGISLTLEEAENHGRAAGRHAFKSMSSQWAIEEEATLRMTFFRDISSTNQANVRIPSAQYDEIHLAFGPEPSSWNENVELAADVLGVIGKVNVVQGADPEDTSTLQQLMTGFSNQHRHMMEGLDDSFKSLEKRRRQLDEEAARKDAERRKAHEEALADLDEKRSELRLQSHMSERREIYRALTSQAASEVRRSMAPKGAMYARWAVFATSLIIAAVSGLFAYTSLLQFGISDDAVSRIVNLLDDGAEAATLRDAIGTQLVVTDWYLIGRTILSSLVSIGALVYAASWMRGFYASDIDAAREVNKFNLDLARASWVIETVLEVQHEKKGDVPQAWIDGVTSGLFEDKSGATEMDDRAQALKSLLAFTAAASFGPDGPRVELNRKGAKKLSKGELTPDE